jgi:hypothetical protein
MRGVKKMSVCRDVWFEKRTWFRWGDLSRVVLLSDCHSNRVTSSKLGKTLVMG